MATRDERNRRWVSSRRTATFTAACVLNLALAVTLAAGAACDGGAATTLVRAPIIGGATSDASQDAVVLLVATSGAGAQVIGQCSGTLIASNLVLTARHCVSHTSEGPFGCEQDGRLAAGSVGGETGPDYAPAGLMVFVGAHRPDFGSGAVRPAARVARLLHDGAGALCSHDLALAVLDTPLVDGPIAPVRLETPPVAGAPVTVLGWGTTSTTGEPSVRQQRRGVAIRRIGPAPAQVTADGAPLSGPVPAHEFETGEVTCWGDSGGPALDEATGAVVGVTSMGGNGRGTSRNDPGAGCAGSDTFNDFTAVPSFKALVLQAFQEAGAVPWREGEPRPSEATAGGGCTVASEPAGSTAFAWLVAAWALSGYRSRRLRAIGPCRPRVS